MYIVITEVDTDQLKVGLKKYEERMHLRGAFRSTQKPGSPGPSPGSHPTSRVPWPLNFFLEPKFIKFTHFL